MCGIAGVVHCDDRRVDGGYLEAMTSSLAHRGPDGEGYVFLARKGEKKAIAVSGRLSDSLRSVPPGYSVGFGHRRLAVLDLSPLGHQPMSDEYGTCWITYNGEIYNFLELREELKRLGWCFRSMTDTEVILRAYQQWEMKCLDRLNGMFAFAIWDARRKRLFCARDRLGMKPFYYHGDVNQFTFASEIKALLHSRHPPVSANSRMIHDFLVLGLQDHTAETFFEGVHQLCPGHFLLLGEDGHLQIEKWWDVEPCPAQNDMSHEEAISSFVALFEDSVRLHLRSDVPVGSCLSGGLDSSSIVCTMHRLLSSHDPPEEHTGGGVSLNTFSACFEDPSCDERPYLRSVVAHTGSESVETFPDGRRLFDDLPRILYFQDEPLASTSFLAQWALMQAVSQCGVKVLLDGQGGDELLCGYPGYWGSHLGDLVRKGSLLSALLESWAYYRQQFRIHPTVLANFARALLPPKFISGARWRLKKHGMWINPEFASQYTDRTWSIGYEQGSPSALQNHVVAYLKTHSLPALLHHEDRSSMAFSVEARLPFLDARLVDFLTRLPASLKLRDGRSKVILRKGLQNVLPEVVRNRNDKMGFATPQDRWLRETFRPDIETLFNSHQFEGRGYWKPSALKTAYRKYCQGENGIGSSVWRCVNVELWHQRFFT